MYDLSCWGRCKGIHAPLYLDIPVSLSPCKTDHTSPQPLTAITLSRVVQNQKTSKSPSQKKSAFKSGLEGSCSWFYPTKWGNDVVAIWGVGWCSEGFPGKDAGEERAI